MNHVHRGLNMEVITQIGFWNSRIIQAHIRFEPKTTDEDVKHFKHDNWRALRVSCFLICIEHNQTFWLFKQMLACFFFRTMPNNPWTYIGYVLKTCNVFLIYLRFPGPCWFLKYDVPILQQRIHVQYRCYSEGNWTVRDAKFSNVEHCSGSTSQDFNQDLNF